MNVEPAPKVFLQNKLSRCRNKLQELELLLPVKSEFIADNSPPYKKYNMLYTEEHEAEKLEGLVSAYTQDRTLGDLDEVREVG